MISKRIQDIWLSIFPLKFRYRILKKKSQKYSEFKLILSKSGAPHEYKQYIIRKYKDFNQSKVLIETGTYLGHMIDAQLLDFHKIFSIEVDEKLSKRAKIKYRNFKHIEIIHGDSAIKIDYLLRENDFKSNIIFWLDGHYSGGITGKGQKECPIVEEIESILKLRKKFNDIILIDDARCFDGTNSYPTIQEIKNQIKNYRSNFDLKVENDIIIII